jgi:glycosyltransferase involved in cell wall biosynthesis
MKPLFTIGIPVFNGMPYLPESIESMLAQSYPHFEVIVVNDGSTDDSLRYLQNLRDPRVRVISQPNRGITAALNRALEEARAPWLVRMDADDISHPERLAWLSEAIQHSPDAGMFYSDAANHRHSRAISKLRTTQGTPEELRTITENGYLLSICHVTAALNVSKTRSLGGYRFDLLVEDLDLWWRMALKHKIVFVPKVMVAVRLHNDSTCIRNLDVLTINTLYVQYLLLSHLWNLPALTYERVFQHLRDMIDPYRLQYRREMWMAGGCIGNGQYLRALPHLAHALTSSPRDFLTRLQHVFRPNGLFYRGVDPMLFRNRQNLLWISETAALGEAV